MKQIEFIEREGACYTPCPHKPRTMVGSIQCLKCMYCECVMRSGACSYVDCSFDNYNVEKTQLNTLGRLKVEFWEYGRNRIGYIDGYVGSDNATCAVVYCPEDNTLYTINIGELRIINMKE